LQLHILVQL